ncbi:MAG: endonuclease NucS domain-containing protein [Planktothrix sp.]
MSAYVRLQKTGSGWEFQSEVALEDFLWENLGPLFGLTPLKRQHYVKEQFCDIIAVAENQQLVILELKNVEDRYIVQQLTRYYDALLQEKPFREQIDYDRPVRLVAIAPRFHRDNLTDRKYHPLSLEFWQFSVIHQEETFNLQLTNVDSGVIVSTEIGYQSEEMNDNLPLPPRSFFTLLNKCNKIERNAISKIRHNLLKIDSRMQEIVLTSNSIVYGKNKTHYCAEFRWNDKANQPVLFLKLPLLTRTKSTGRLRIWTDWEKVTDLSHVTKGIGRIQNLEELNKSGKSLEKYYEFLYNHSDKLKSSLALPIESYLKWLKIYRKEIPDLEQYDCLDNMINLALEQWLSKF